MFFFVASSLFEFLQIFIGLPSFFLSCPFVNSFFFLSVARFRSVLPVQANFLSLLKASLVLLVVYLTSFLFLLVTVMIIPTKQGLTHVAPYNLIIALVFILLSLRLVCSAISVCQARVVVFEKKAFIFSGIPLCCLSLNQQFRKPFR